MNFSEYLLSKKIDAEAFERYEKSLFDSWKEEFEKMHPNSFTVQKLNLINPVRRKYRLSGDTTETSASSETPVPKIARPMVKPKPKIN